MLQMETIRGKTALITGSARRLGREIALSLAKQGVNIIVHYNKSEKESISLLKSLKALGVKVGSVKADLKDETEIAKIAKDVSYDFIINNASIFPEGDLKHLSYQTLQENFSVHSFAPLLFAKSFLKKKRKGAIINIIDCKIDTHHRTHLAYHLSKKSLKDVTLFLAKELAPDVRVNAIAPGLVIPPDKTDAKKYTQGVIEINPLKRIPTVNEICQAVQFFLNSPSITGQILYLDGGRSLND